MKGTIYSYRALVSHSLIESVLMPLASTKVHFVHSKKEGVGVKCHNYVLTVRNRHTLEAKEVSLS